MRSMVERLYVQGLTWGLSTRTGTPLSSKCSRGPIPESMSSFGVLNAPQHSTISAVALPNRSCRTRLPPPFHNGMASVVSIPTARPPSMTTRDTVTSLLTRRLGIARTGPTNAAHAVCLCPPLVVVRFIGPPTPSFVHVGSSLWSPFSSGD